jgi:hypothetical protein
MDTAALLETVTHHFVDDLAVLDGFCEPWQLAIDLIRFHGHLPVEKFRIAPGGRSMTLDMTGSRLADNYVNVIRQLIILRQLPVETKRQRYSLKGAIFQDKLIITYTGR